MSTIQIRIKHAQGSFVLDTAFEVPAQGVTSLFGPSGSGKTTLLRCITGLVRPDSAHISVNGDLWHDNRICLPPHRRPVGYVFQEPSLFPHLSVIGNLQYGWKRVPAADRVIPCEQAVAWLGLEPLLNRMPAGLSGGERQRVAIARAILTSPKLLLMDEPLSALDESSRREILPYLMRILRELKIPCLYVSHTLNEVLQIARTMVCIREGRIVAIGSPHKVAHEVAAGSMDPALRDSVILRARVAEHDDNYRLSRLDTGIGSFWTKAVDLPVGAEANLWVDPHDVSIALSHEPNSSLINQLLLTIEAIEPDDHGQVLIRLSAGGEETLNALITRRSLDHLILKTRQQVYARVKATKQIL
ncbi:MAG: ABC transporter ATPase [Candidatus Hydrogenedentota bacterium]